MLRVSSYTSSPGGDGSQRVSATVGDLEVWFELPAGWQPSLRGESLVAAALLPAMAGHTVLELAADTPVDREFLENIEQLQEVFLAWQGVLGLQLRRVRIEAPVDLPLAGVTRGVLSFFSGGVDGTYTAMRHRAQINTAVLLRGIDMQLDNEALWQAAVQSAQRLADHLELPLVTVATNVRFLGYHHGLKWARHYQGAGLAAVGHLLGGREILVAATSSLADLAPYGSHPLTDPLWSSGQTTFVHDGAVPRTEKLREISTDPVVREVLRVCWHDSGYNCGVCGKCLRTRVALHLLGVDAPSFPGPLDWKAVSAIRLGDPSEWAFFEALEQLERERPDAQARSALRKIRRRSLLHSAARDLDAALGHPLRSIGRWSRREAV